MPFSHANLEQLDIIENLAVNSLKEELVLLPFNSKVKDMDCQVDARYIQPEWFDSLDIVPTTLRFENIS